MTRNRERSWPRSVLHLVISVVLLSVVMVGATTHSAAAQTITAKTLQVNQCDPALGAVESIEFTVTGDLIWEASAESLDPNAVTLTHTLLVVYTYGPGPFHTANAGTSSTFAVTLGFDGVEDFAGNSGFADGGTIPLVHTFVVTGASLAPFIGTGTASLALTETATQSVTSTGGNLTSAIGNFSVLQAATSCTHTPPDPVTPEPPPDPVTPEPPPDPVTPEPPPDPVTPEPPPDPVTPDPVTPEPRATVVPATPTPISTASPTAAPRATVVPTAAPMATAVVVIVPTPTPTTLNIKEPPVFGDPSTRGDSVPPTFGGAVPSGPDALTHGPADTPTLALTGNTTAMTFLGAMVLLSLGGLAVIAGRKRTT